MQAFVHSVYATKDRVLPDLPMMGNRTRTVLVQLKMMCTNPECSRKTFSERFESFDPYARRRKRLDEKALDLALDTGAISASYSLRWCS